MYRFLRHIGGIIILSIVILFVLDTLYSYTFSVSEPRSKIQKILQLKDVHYDFAFLGSSRTENHIDCEVVERLTGKSCMNFGISGGSVGDMLVLVQLMESQNVTFDKAFLQIDYNYNGSGLSSNFKARLMPFIHIPGVKDKLGDVKVSFAETYIPFYRYMKYDQVVGFREFFTSVLNRKPRTDLSIGFAPKIGVGQAVSTSFPEKFDLTNPEIENLASLVEKSGSELVYFTAPYCPETKNRDTALEILKTRIPELHDYSGLYDQKLEYYYNCGHLNIEGARDFTKVVTTELLLNQAD